jgi:hypothetical protein
MNLIYINELGPNFRGDNIYEFIFSDVDDAYGEDWDVEPAAGRPSPPKIDFIKKVGNKLYERDVVLNWEKNLVSNETYEL